MQVETDRGRIKASEDTAPAGGIFAAGDVTTGPATVVRALAGGREAAVMMNRHMEGAPLSVETGECRQGWQVSFRSAGTSAAPMSRTCCRPESVG